MATTPEQREAIRQARIALRQQEIAAREAERAAVRAARKAAADARAREVERLEILATVPEIATLPRVLLIGDSISMGYTLRVRAILGDANVQRIPNNGGNTRQILPMLDKWLATGGSDEWDVIHFNSGIHDAIRNDDPPAVSDISLAEYATNLQAIVDRLKAVSTKVVFATTTPNPVYLPRYGDHVAYNAVAVPIMQQNGVPVNDLYTVILPHFAEYGHGVHYLPRGYNILASHVASAIEAWL